MRNNTHSGGRLQLPQFHSPSITSSSCFSSSHSALHLHVRHILLDSFSNQPFAVGKKMSQAARRWYRVGETERGRILQKISNEFIDLMFFRSHIFEFQSLKA